MDPNAIPIRDLHLPAVIGWWPLAPGWWVVIAVLGVGLVFLMRMWLRTYSRGAARRHALRQLDLYSRDYMSHLNGVLIGTQLSELLRRTMLAYAPRTDVAGLTGEAWLKWLDQDLDRSHFVAGDGRYLIEWPYRDPGSQVDKSDVGALVDAVRLRLRTPVRGAA
ncbi:MAG: DUF4381 domain-containing protein [Woeseiaceae bacterium]